MGEYIDLLIMTNLKNGWGHSKSILIELPRIANLIEITQPKKPLLQPVFCQHNIIILRMQV